MTRLRFVVLASLCFLGAVVGGAASPMLFSTSVTAQEPEQAEDEIRARSFVLVDAKGEKRATLGFDSDGRTRLALYDEDGAGRAGMVASRDLTTIQVREPGEERGVISLGLNSEYGPALEMFDNGTAHYVLLSTNKGKPVLHLNVQTKTGDQALDSTAVVRATKDGGSLAISPPYKPLDDTGSPPPGSLLLGPNKNHEMIIKREGEESTHVWPPKKEKD